MTVEEAITILKIAKTEVEWNYPLDYAIAIDTAIETLEKQIPKKTKKDGAFGKCSKCRYVFNSELCNEYNVRYCPSCGQFIDWSEEE